MAEKRMFAKFIVESDAFMDLPHSTQVLYFHLSMNADDDGFVNNVKRIMVYAGCSEGDLNVLFTAGLIIYFERGVVAIRHWKVNNYIRSDRYKATLFLQEKAQLVEDKSGVYTLSSATGIPAVYQMDTNGEHSIEENSIEEISIGESNAHAHARERFSPPTLEEVQAYCDERNNGISGEHFVNYYTDHGWENVNDWKARVRSWETNGIDDKKRNNSASPPTTKSGTATVPGDKADELFAKALDRSYGNE